MSPRQARENAAFLRRLAATGNARMAARECGLHRGTLEKRRRRHPAFAAEWDAALAFYHAHSCPGAGAGAGEGADQGTRPAAPAEPVLVRRRDGSRQLRAAGPGALTRARVQLFLRALAAGGNVRLAARAAGAAHSSFYKLAERDPAFRADMALAREMAADRLETALLGRAHQALAGASGDAAWADAARDDPMPPMSVDQALMLWNAHRRLEALGSEWGRLATRRRRGPLSSEEIALERRIWWTLEQARHAAETARQSRAATRADHYEATGNWHLPGEEVGDLPWAGKGRGKKGG